MLLHMCFACMVSRPLTTAVCAACARGPRHCAPAAVGDRAPFPTAVRDALARGALGRLGAALLVAVAAQPFVAVDLNHGGAAHLVVRREPFLARVGVLDGSRALLARLLDLWLICRSCGRGNQQPETPFVGHHPALPGAGVVRGARGVCGQGG